MCYLSKASNGFLPAFSRTLEHSFAFRAERHAGFLGAGKSLISTGSLGAYLECASRAAFAGESGVADRLLQQRSRR